MGIVENVMAHMEQTGIDVRQETKVVHMAERNAVKGREKSSGAHPHVDKDHENGHEIVGKLLKIDRQEQMVPQRHLPKLTIETPRRVSKRSQLLRKILSRWK